MNRYPDFLPGPFGDIVREAFSIILKQASVWQLQLFLPLLPASMQHLRPAMPKEPLIQRKQLNLFYQQRNGGQCM
jgi:hypothetical protein